MGIKLELALLDVADTLICFLGDRQAFAEQVMDHTTDERLRNLAEAEYQTVTAVLQAGLVAQGDPEKFLVLAARLQETFEERVQ